MQLIRRLACGIAKENLTTVRRASSLWHSRGMTSSRPIEYVDIGVNLGDGMFKGRYHGKKAHPPDLNSVLQRSRDAGVVAQIVTAGDLNEIKEAVALAKQHDDLFATAGIHPTRTSNVDGNPQYMNVIRAMLNVEARTRNSSGRVVAIGECGLDYDRLQFSSKEMQKKHFPAQLQLAKEYSLPLFLHCRAAQQDFLEIVRAEADAIAAACANEATQQDPLQRSRIGVAHCFTGTVAEMHELVASGLFVGLTGCSFKEPDGIRVAEEVPLERLLLETDAPWCDMRPTHASAPLIAAFAKKEPNLAGLYGPASLKKEKWEEGKLVKSRNEPCAIGNVAAVIAEAKGVDIDVVAKAARENSRYLFGI